MILNHTRSLHNLRQEKRRIGQYIFNKKYHQGCLGLISGVEDFDLTILGMWGQRGNFKAQNPQL